MATGLSGSEHGGVIDPVDLRGAGSMDWTEMVGVDPGHALVGAGAESGYNVEQNPWGRVVTTQDALAGPAGDTIATPDGGTTSLGHWTDVFNLRGSVVPWLLILLVAILYFSHLKLSARGSAGGFGKHVSAGAKLD